MPGGTPSAASEPTAGSMTSMTTRYSPAAAGAARARSTEAVAPGAMPAGSIVDAPVPPTAAADPRDTQRATTRARDAGSRSASPTFGTTATWPHAALPRFEMAAPRWTIWPGPAVAADWTAYAAVRGPVTRTTSAGTSAWVGAS